MKTTFFERLERTLDKRGVLTLSDLSKKVTISPGTIQGWKSEGSIPQARVLKKLVDLLNVPKEWLIGESDIEPKWEGPGNLPSATNAARYNFEGLLMALKKHPESDRAINWMGSMMLMISQGIDSKGDKAMEKIVKDIAEKIFKSARGEKVDIA